MQVLGSVVYLWRKHAQMATVNDGKTSTGRAELRDGMSLDVVKKAPEKSQGGSRGAEDNYVH
jgi:hypothetical protein